MLVFGRTNPGIESESGEYIVLEQREHESRISSVLVVLTLAAELALRGLSAGQLANPHELRRVWTDKDLDPRQADGLCAIEASDLLLKNQ